MKTIKDIAKLAQVSSGTVDRVLHNRGGVSKKTAARIRKIIEDSGFTPNLVARSLKLNKECNIVVFIPSHDVINPFWELPNAGVQKAISEISSFGAKVHVVHFDQHDSTSFVNGLEDILSMDNLDGIIMVPLFVKETVEHKQRLNDKGIPYMFMNVDLKGFQNVSFVGQNSFESGYLSARLFHLTQRKSSTVLIVEMLEDIENYYGLDNRIRGFLDYFDKNDSTLTIERLKIPKYQDQGDFQKILTKTLVSKSMIKGIFLPSGSICHVGKYLDDFELKMDVVIGYDITTENIAYIRNGQITFLIDQEPVKQGYQSVKLLFEHLANKVALKEKYLSPIHVVMNENLNYYL